MSELRVFFGHHKCASRYFRMQVLGPAAERLAWTVTAYAVRSEPFHFRRLDELDLRHIDYAAVGAARNGFLMLSNASARVVRAVRATGRPIRGVRLLRDPRQVVVSSYLHHLDGHDEAAAGWVWDKLVEDRRILQRLDFRSGLRYELNNISRELLDTQLFGWKSDDSILEIKLEDYVREPGDWNARIAEHLHMPRDILTVPDSTSTNPESRPWQECFDADIRSLFKRRYGSDLVRMGYASDLEW